MSTFKYVLKRLGAFLLTFFVIITISFVLIRLLQPEQGLGEAAKIEAARREALGYNKPILVQYGIYLKNVITKWDWGTSWKIEYMKNVSDIIAARLPSTIYINLFSILLSVPIGIGIGIYAAVHKNKWQDHFLSTLIMVFVSVPSYVYAFLLQYLLGYKAGWFPVIMSSLYDVGGNWLSAKMLRSMVLPVLALSFGTIASLARFTRAELTEALTSDYMLLARTKGLTKSQAIVRHALKNAMVPILPSILGMFISILGGSLIIEKIFAINGVGNLIVNSINLLDYDVFIATSAFYSAIGLLGAILTDLSYGFLDPRVRMGER